MKRKSKRASTGHGTGVLMRAPLSQMLRPKLRRNVTRNRRSVMRNLLRAEVEEQQQPEPVGDFKPVKVV